MSPTTFYALTYKEAKLILEGYKQEQEDDYYHNYYAVYNAIGAFLGGKKFAHVEVFENSKKEDKKEDKKKATKEEKQQILDMFRDYDKAKGDY
ncbi:MAG: hypothetical protein E7E92_02100 [Clostridiales bacterium]|nr:hypothetical protein [Clostridiales bacterium]